MRLVLAVCLAAALGLSCGGNTPKIECTAEQTACAGACADLKLDNQHCGACGNACGADQACGGSQCWPRACGNQTCADGLVCADGVCADRTCFAVTCEAGQRCAGGACYAAMCSNQTCTSGQVCVDGACADAACVGVLCPAGLKCSRGTCFADSCGDGMKSGAETDADCGGPVCRACATGQSCAAPIDCESRICTAMTCGAPSCADNVRNGQEGDVDCGGSCPLCADGKSCSAGTQCQSGHCGSGRCSVPACGDGIKNGTESDKDCGGSCPACAEGLACNGPADCTSTRCASGKCVSALCGNGMKDNGESDLDCGGPCAPCVDGKVCNNGPDCASGVCSLAMRCVAPSCADNVKNGSETDLDCGGPCMPCAVGKGCRMGGDCVSRSCQNGTCFAPTCSDGVANGVETDSDCGGNTGCPRCAPDAGCLMGSDCASNGCTMMHCDAPLVFWPAVTVTTGANPRGITITDIDNDGLDDLATANYDSFDVSLMFQRLDGGLVPQLSLQVSTTPDIRGPTSVAIGDMNGDGIKDLVVPRNSIFAGSNYQAWGGCRIGILKGVGSRQFLGSTDSEWKPERSGCGYTSVLARLNADALIDLVASDGIDGCSGAGMPRSTEPDLYGGWTFMQAGDGGFSVPGNAEGTLGPHIAVGDVNNDGNADIVGHSSRQGLVRVQLGMGNGTFPGVITFGVSAGQGDVVLGNFNGDTNLDIAVASESGNVIAVAMGVGNGMFIAPVSYPVATPVALRAADIDGDGKLDLVVGTTGIAVLTGRGDGTFGPASTVYPALGRIHAMATGDLNGDSRPDVAVIAGGVLRVLYNRGP